MGIDQSKRLKNVKKNFDSYQSNRTLRSLDSNQQSSNENVDNLFDGKIVVVSKGKNLANDNLKEKEFLNFLLSHQFSPLLPKHQDTIPANYQQIDSISMNNLCRHIQNYLKEKSELLVRDQNLIYERIKKIDYVTAFIANLVLEKEKNQNKTFDILNKIYDLKTLTHTYQCDLDRCLKNIRILNELIDYENRIEIDDL